MDIYFLRNNEISTNSLVIWELFWTGFVPNTKDCEGGRWGPPAQCLSGRSLCMFLHPRIPYSRGS